ncbi:MAG: outer membrane beta-barrel protein, partial [Bacteroidales bacterium]|nr:outer membrane beta-barrel protein [Bacteroidales bacterium]
YPLAGFGMTGINRDYAPLGLDKENDTKFAFNFGAGMEFMFSPRMGMNLEYKYRIVDSWNRSHFSFGVIYKF